MSFSSPQYSTMVPLELLFTASRSVNCSTPMNRFRQFLMGSLRGSYISQYLQILWGLVYWECWDECCMVVVICCLEVTQAVIAHLFHTSTAWSSRLATLSSQAIILLGQILAGSKWHLSAEAAEIRREGGEAEDGKLEPEQHGSASVKPHRPLGWGWCKERQKWCAGFWSQHFHLRFGSLACRSAVHFSSPCS